MGAGGHVCRPWLPAGLRDVTEGYADIDEFVS